MHSDEKILGQRVEDRDRQRKQMVENQIRKRGILDERVLNAMAEIPRHRFVPDGLIDSAYNDCPLAIGHGQTISQPYIVALMTELVHPKLGDRALDVGTGCGYHAAVLARLVKQVYSIEIVDALAKDAAHRLSELGYRNIEVRVGDAYQGWIERAPFDIIVVAAAPDHVPAPLVEQLALGGRMVIPVGDHHQQLLLIEKQTDGQICQTYVAAVAFVPMTGAALRTKK